MLSFMYMHSFWLLFALKNPKLYIKSIKCSYKVQSNSVGVLIPLYWVPIEKKHACICHHVLTALVGSMLSFFWNCQEIAAGDSWPFLVLRPQKIPGIWERPQNYPPFSQKKSYLNYIYSEIFILTISPR